jgi:hypothetical protein
MGRPDIGENNDRVVKMCERKEDAYKRLLPRKDVISEKSLHW